MKDAMPTYDIVQPARGTRWNPPTIRRRRERRGGGVRFPRAARPAKPRGNHRRRRRGRQTRLRREPPRAVHRSDLAWRTRRIAGSVKLNDEELPEMYGWLSLSGETDVEGMARATFDALGCEMLRDARRRRRGAHHQIGGIRGTPWIRRRRRRHRGRGGLVPRHAPRQIARRRVRERRAGTRVSRRGVRRDATGRHPEARSGGYRRPRREKSERETRSIGGESGASVSIYDETADGRSTRALGTVSVGAFPRPARPVRFVRTLVDDDDDVLRILRVLGVLRPRVTLRRVAPRAAALTASSSQRTRDMSTTLMVAAADNPTTSPHHRPASPAPATKVSTAPTGMPKTQNPRKLRHATVLCLPMPRNTPPPPLARRPRAETAQRCTRFYRSRESRRDRP